MTTAYATYTYYHNTYLGNVISETDFPRLALRASAQIDALTFGRAATDTDNGDAIKMAACAIAEEIQKTETNGGANIASVSVGPYSETYTATNADTTPGSRYYDAAQTYLAETGLMFAGV